MKTVPVCMPQMGQSAAEGTIVKWHKNDGDQIAADEILVEVESDKISVEVESPGTGKLEGARAVGETVPVGEIIATIVTDEPEEEEAKPHAGDSKGDQEVVDTAAMPTSIDVPHLPEFTSDWLSPSVMRFALLNNVTGEELKTLEGTGRNGRVTRDDVLAYVGRRASPAAGGNKAATPEIRDGDEIIPMTTIRRTIADHMVQSIHTSAHVTMVHAVDMTTIVALRSRLKEAFLSRYGIKMTYTAVLMYMTSRVLPDYPMINASVVGTNILRRSQINIGCAVALQDESLVVPVVKDADKKSFPELAVDLDRLIACAREKSLQRQDIEDGTFTISNFGAFGSIMGTPIINQPQVGIIGVGAIFKSPVLIEDKLATRDQLYLNFSFDHRVIDGAMGGRFLNAIQTALEAVDVETLSLEDLA